jgi:hypothetical protein
VDPKDLSIDFSGWDNLKLFLRTAAALSLTHQTVDEKSSRDEIRHKLYNIGIHYEEMCRRFNVTDEQVIEANMIKLMKRYPGGYTNEHAKLRLDKQEPIVEKKMDVL